MTEAALYPRHAEARLAEALDDTPVVLIHGPRQCGKTTLARMVGDARGFAYFSFDDEGVLDAARADPIGFVADLPERTILDEVQRVPALFPAVKTAVDRRRVPGRFLLTGSSNVLLVPALSESLAGRMEILRLHPLSQCELVRREPRFLRALFAAGFRTKRYERLGLALAERIVAGGYPAALSRAASRRRAAWYRNYVETIVQRDVRELARIRSLDVVPRLLELAAGQTARLLNVSDLAGAFSLSRPTIREYVTLLQRIFLVDEIPAWTSRRLGRLLKTPKIHVGDTGPACVLLRLDESALREDREAFGRLVETFVFQELRRQAAAGESEIRFHHYRDRDAFEVDLVLEQGGRRLCGVEVKASATVTRGDFRGLRKFQAAAGSRFACGVVLYDGEASVGFGDGLYAVPIRALWEPL